MDTAVVIAAIAAAGATGAGVFAWQASSSANAVTVKASAGERIAIYYQEKLAVASERLKRILQQVDLLTDMLDKMDITARDAADYRDQLLNLRVAAVSLYPELVELRAHLETRTAPADGSTPSEAT